MLILVYSDQFRALPLSFALLKSNGSDVGFVEVVVVVLAVVSDDMSRSGTISRKLISSFADSLDALSNNNTSCAVQSPEAMYFMSNNTTQNNTTNH